MHTGRSGVASGSLQIGVVIPAFHGRRYIVEALASVARQTVSGDIVTVVVEDGTPPEAAVADLARQHGARYLALPENRGVFAARTAGFRSLPPCRYVAFLDQDDWWEPGFLETLSTALEEHPEAPLAASNVIFVDGKSATPFFSDRKPRLTLADFKVVNQLATPSHVLCRYERVQQLGLEARLAYPGSDDWLLWLGLLRYGDGVYVDTPLAYWRVHEAAFHHLRLAMRASEDAVVREWYPRLGFDHADVAHYWGRVALDALVQRNSTAEWMWGLGHLLLHPRAVLEAVRFRREHKRSGVV
ncbi:MAG: glycosyltransferase family 2 protein [Clostridia bacterium]